MVGRNRHAVQRRRRAAAKSPLASPRLGHVASGGGWQGRGTEERGTVPMGEIAVGLEEPPARKMNIDAALAALG